MIEFLELVPYLVVAFTTALLTASTYYVVDKYRHWRLPVVVTTDLPRPKMAPSDYIVYVYHEDGHVAKRWVEADEEDAWDLVEELKVAETRGHLFKDGEILEKW